MVDKSNCMHVAVTAVNSCEIDFLCRAFSSSPLHSTYMIAVLFMIAMQHVHRSLMMVLLSLHGYLNRLYIANYYYTKYSLRVQSMIHCMRIERAISRVSFDAKFEVEAGSSLAEVFLHSLGHSLGCIATYTYIYILCDVSNP